MSDHLFADFPLADPLDRLAPAAAIQLMDLVFPEQTNHHGTLFGGAALAMLDKLAFIIGSRALRRTVVTAGAQQLDFRAPVPAGQLAQASGHVLECSARSATIALELVSENLLTGQRTSCVRGQFVVAASEAAQADPNIHPAPPTPEPPAAEGVFEFDTAPDSVHMAEIIFPGHANHRGILHGGPALAWLAKAGFAAASRRVRLPVVMAASEKLDFVAPAHVGDIAFITAAVTGTGRSSITVAVTMHAEQPQGGARRLCTRASFIFVAIGEDGRSLAHS